MHNSDPAGLEVAIQLFSMVFFWIPAAVASVWLPYRIIKKTGYPGAWVLIILAPTIEAVIGVVVTVIAFGADRSVGAFVGILFLILFILLMLLNFVMYLVFAFSKWPILRRLELAKSAAQARANTSVTLSKASTTEG